MSAMVTTLNGKQLYAFLNGICKAKYAEDKDITPEFLHENIFPEETSLQEVVELMKNYETVFNKAAYEGCDLQEFIDFIKTEGITNEDQVNAWSKIWKVESANIRSSIVLNSRRIPSYSGVNWRIDVLSNTVKKNDELPQPIALVEIQTTASNKKVSNSSAKQSFFFEVDKQSLDVILKTFDDIENAIAKSKTN